jgi:hypothetical protein
MEGIRDPAVQQRSQGAGASAAWALQMQVGVDGTPRVEAVLLRRKAQQEDRYASHTNKSRRQPGFGSTAALCGKTQNEASR